MLFPPSSPEADFYIHSTPPTYYTTQNQQHKINPKLQPSMKIKSVVVFLTVEYIMSSIMEVSTKVHPCIISEVSQLQ